MFNSSYLDKKIDDVLATSNGLLSNLDHCPMMKSVDKGKKVCPAGNISSHIDCIKILSEYP